jgi:nucleotide-binding universal stress UspA family protein
VIKVLATFDGSALSSATLPQLSMLAQNPTTAFTLLAVAHTQKGRLKGNAVTPEPASGEISQTTPVLVAEPGNQQLEAKSQAIERRLNELEDYLHGLGTRIPAEGRITFVARISEDPAETIVEVARGMPADVIVMATRGVTGLKHAMFGSVTEQVIRSGVAPVLVVHPPKE